MSDNGTYLEDRSTLTLRAIEKFAGKPQRGLDQLDISYDVNRQTRMCMVMCPEWDPSFPPYNIARLAGVVKSAGYACKSFDLNIESYLAYKNEEWPLWFNPWSGPYDWKWIGEQYWDELHQYVQPVLDRCIDNIIEFQPNVVGFTLYYCNIEPVHYMIDQIKKRNSDIKILIGGPNTHYSYFEAESSYDYVINGEGEKPLLQLLESLENQQEVEYTEKRENTLIVRQPEESRLDLSNLPFPDYTDFPMSEYRFANGALCAISRGCTAKCTFCEETHYYKYRQRTAVSTLEEVKFMYDNYGTRVFQFTDSLVNGNLRELRAFAEGVKAAELDIKWTGYARCDGRMDLEYYQALADSGCYALNYGIESGSQSVLDAMDKRVTIKEMEDNFRDGAATGVMAHTNWITAFPNERPVDFEDSLTFLWRQRDKGLLSIGQGPGFGVGVDGIVGQNLQRFGLSQYYYYDHWIREDFGLSIVHKMVKQKMFSIFTDLLVTDENCAKPTRHNLAERHYTIEFNDPDRLNHIEYDYHDFDYNIIKTDKGNFVNTLVNEVWPFLRVIWRARGGYRIKLLFVPEWEYAEWGDRAAAPLDAEYIFEIDDEGNWTADFKWKYQQGHLDYEWNDHKWTDHNGVEHVSPDTWGPTWGLVNFYSNNSNSAVRARKLAWKGDERFKGRDPWDAFSVEDFDQQKQDFMKIRNTDLSFEHAWQGSGKWDV